MQHVTEAEGEGVTKDLPARPVTFSLGRDHCIWILKQEKDIASSSNIFALSLKDQNLFREP